MVKVIKYPIINLNGGGFFLELPVDSQLISVKVKTGEEFPSMYFSSEVAVPKRQFKFIVYPIGSVIQKLLDNEQSNYLCMFTVNTKNGDKEDKKNYFLYEVKMKK